MLKGWSGRDIVKRVLRIGQGPTHVPPFCPIQVFPNHTVQEITSSLPMFEKERELKLLHRNRRDKQIIIRIKHKLLSGSKKIFWERKGKERKGKERNGTERNGREGKGREGKGLDWTGLDRTGEETRGEERKGKERKGTERNGTEGKGREGKGKDWTGLDWTGLDRTGEETRGEERKGKERKETESGVSGHWTLVEKGSSTIST